MGKRPSERMACVQPVDSGEARWGWACHQHAWGGSSRASRNAGSRTRERLGAARWWERQSSLPALHPPLAPHSQLRCGEKLAPS